MKRLIVISLLLSSFSCQYDPFASEYTKRQPSTASLVGLYKPDDETSNRLRSELKVEVAPTCELLLRSDGSFSARDMPDCFLGPDIDCRPGVQQWDGEWSLRKQQQWWSVHLTIRRGPNSSFGLPAMIRRDQPPYILHLIIGDPDSGNGLAFQRASGKAA